MTHVIKLVVVGIGCALFTWLIRHLYEEKVTPAGEDMVGKLRKSGF